MSWPQHPSQACSTRQLNRECSGCKVRHRKAPKQVNEFQVLSLCSPLFVWRWHHYIKVLHFYHTKSPYRFVGMNSAAGKNHVYTVNETGVFCRSLMEGDKKLSVTPTLVTPETWNCPHLCVSHRHRAQEGDSGRNSLVLNLQRSTGGNSKFPWHFYRTVIKERSWRNHISSESQSWKCKSSKENDAPWEDSYLACELQGPFNESIERWWSHTYPGLISGGLGKGFRKPFFPTSQYVSSTPLP